MRFLALGDSYTIGEGVAEAERWPVQLAQALGIDAPEIIARTGWTTDELAAAMAQYAFRPPYDLVTLLIGVNNQYRGRDVFNYRGEFSALLERAITLAHGRADRVLVLSIPDWGVTPFAANDKRDAATIGAEVDAFNERARRMCEKEGATFVDITPVSRERGAEAEMLADDGLHPSAAMYTLWTQAALPVARSLLAK